MAVAAAAGGPLRKAGKANRIDFQVARVTRDPMLRCIMCMCVCVCVCVCAGHGYPPRSGGRSGLPRS